MPLSGVFGVGLTPVATVWPPPLGGLLTYFRPVNLAPFEIHISDQRLATLRTRLQTTVWADDPMGPDDWTYGVSGSYLRHLVGYWLDRYDWRAQESAINRWPHVRVEIEGVTVHALHARGSGPDPLPLVLTHGWPWTFWDFAEVVEPLAHPERFGGDVADAFDVVVPSLPGSVFSAPTPPGIGWRATAGLWVKLMEQLGYRRFGAHGGDSGAYVTAQLAHQFPERLIGAHLSFPALLGADLGSIGRDNFEADEVEFFDLQQPSPHNLTHFLTQTLEPQTLAWAMQDSPTGLAAWMLQRRRAWSDCGGDIARRFSEDQLITSFALYWLTGTVASAMRFYADSFRAPWTPSHDRKPVLQAPTGIAVFPYELVHVPRAVAEREANLVHWTRMDRGGHFAAAEEPQLIVEDLRNFFRPLRGSVA
jgi:pimeloyl-ACP methyl ester carboxylesterase